MHSQYSSNAGWCSPGAGIGGECTDLCGPCVGRMAMEPATDGTCAGQAGGGAGSASGGGAGSASGDGAGSASGGGAVSDGCGEFSVEACGTGRAEKGKGKTSKEEVCLCGSEARERAGIRDGTGTRGGAATRKGKATGQGTTTRQGAAGTGGGEGAASPPVSSSRRGGGCHCRCRPGAITSSSSRSSSG